GGRAPFPRVAGSPGKETTRPLAPVRHPGPSGRLPARPAKIPRGRAAALASLQGDRAAPGPDPRQRRPVSDPRPGATAATLRCLGQAGRGISVAAAAGCREIVAVLPRSETPLTGKPFYTADHRTPPERERNQRAAGLISAGRTAGIKPAA